MRVTTSLAAGIPRIPLSQAFADFELCATRGANLVAVHLLSSSSVDRPIATFTDLAIAEVVLATFSYDLAPRGEDSRLPRRSQDRLEL